MKIAEINTKNASLNLTVDGGSIEGYVVNSNQPQLTNYLESQGATPNIISAIKNQYNRVGIIKNIYVDEDSRGQGIGNKLVSSAIDVASSNSAEAIVLVSDTAEDNVMNLTKWYEGFGFDQIGTAGGDPVMVLEL